MGVNLPSTGLSDYVSLRQDTGRSGLSSFREGGCDGLLLSQASLLDSHGHLVSNLTPVKESFFGYEGAPHGR